MISHERLERLLIAFRRCGMLKHPPVEDVELLKTMTTEEQEAVAKFEADMADFIVHMARGII